jgi:hypothetical protein
VSKKFFYILIALLMVGALVLGACTPADEPTEVPGEEPGEEPGETR